MKNKPDAYTLEYTGSQMDVIKCDECGFKAVRCQFDETGGCPACIGRGRSGNVESEKNADKKARKIELGHFKKV